MLSQNTIVLEDFNQSNNEYRIINDGVMGGRSQSTIQKTQEGNALFSGQLSLENNGGFASVRILLGNQDLTKVDKIKIKVKGDGRKYSFRIRTNDNFDGVSYRIDFQTLSDEWMEFEFLLSDFKPSFRGRILTNVGPIKAENIRQLGFLLGDKKEGDFALEIGWIKAV